jgi:hypothetical protein
MIGIRVVLELPFDGIRREVDDVSDAEDDSDD